MTTSGGAGVAAAVPAPARALVDLLLAARVVPVAAPGATTGPRVDTQAAVDAFVEAMFVEHGQGLVRMVRLMVDDRNAAEDLVQEGFIRLARSARRIDDEGKAAAYLRSIVLNLARDHNRRGLVSLRHALPFDDRRASVEDEIVLSEEHEAVVDALRDLAPRQRDCLILRYYDELGVDEIAATLGLSRNSIKTHLTRGIRALEAALDPVASDDPAAPAEATP